MSPQRWAVRLNHEYWPWWVIYAPVAPFYLWQALRQWRAAFFTNVNPGIDMGGFFGERKQDIYALLPAGSYPPTHVIAARTSTEQVLDAWRASGIAFPLIVKPDVGERGEGVAVVHDEGGLIRALTEKGHDMLLQAKAPGPHEFALMFLVDPVTRHARLLSICGKRFLAIDGDGASSIKELLARTHRGRRQLVRLEALDHDAMRRIPAKGERVVAEPIGNHCRGTIFHDASQLATPELVSALNGLLAQAHGICYGRVDVRAEDELAFQAGRFSVIELNGVSSEPGSIYDPSWSIWQCWRELLRHVRLIGPLSARLQQMGHEPVPLSLLLRRSWLHFYRASRPRTQQAIAPASQQYHASRAEVRTQAVR
ncbi:MAG: hypothetical protein IPM46_08465 [Flavobacteriales bacterium]|nr:hypothetical protein [Flavobacteriales bacterium]